MTALNSSRRCGGARLPFNILEQHVSGGCGIQTARVLGVHRRQVYRWRASGVTWAQADELAVRIGLHPSAVWGATWWLSDDDEVAGRVCQKHLEEVMA